MCIQGNRRRDQVDRRLVTSFTSLLCFLIINIAENNFNLFLTSFFSDQNKCSRIKNIKHLPP